MKRERASDKGRGVLSQDDEIARQDRLARRKMMRLTGTYGTIGIEFGVGLAVGHYAGRWLDDRFETAPTLMYVMMVLGLSVGFVDLFKLVRNTDMDRLDDPE